MNEMTSHKSMIESVDRFNLFGIPASTYRVERIYHHQIHLYADLFGYYPNARHETPEKADTHGIDEEWFTSEPVMFIVFPTHPDSLPLGFIQLHLISAPGNAAKATMVNQLYVLPEYRNKGAGLKLTEAAVKFAIHNKSAIIRLEILQENLSAKKLFESVGFTCLTLAADFNVYSIQLSYH
jgi:ribosomal protein S18 acetylase RimI-like enzyme